MKLSYQQFFLHLKNNLLPVYLISGNEYMLVQESRDAIITKAKQENFLDLKRFEANKDFDWHKFVESNLALSLFSEKSIIEIKLNHKPTVAAAKIFTEYLEKLDPHHILIILSDKLESATQKSNWYNIINKIGAVITLWPLDPPQLKKWLEQRLQALNLNCDQAAKLYLLEQTEGNLLALAQEVEKLKLLFGDQLITINNIMDAITDHARYDVFNFVDIVLDGNATRIQRVLKKLREEAVEPILLLWAITREIRNLLHIMADLKNKVAWEFILKKYRIWDKRQPLIKKMLKLHSSKNLHKLLIVAEKIDHTIKGLRPGNVWNEIEILSLNLSGFNYLNSY